MDQLASYPLFVDYHGLPLGILTSIKFYTQNSQNPNRNVGVETVKVLTGNVCSFFFRSSQEPPIIENLLGALKYLGTQFFLCPLPNYLKHVRLM
jgi:hypothetical protein